MEILTQAQSNEVSKLAAATANERGLELLRVALRGTKSRPVLEVVLDGQRQVAIDDCEAVSKVIQGYLDVALGGDANYRLDVLSPGVDEPLSHPYQFKRSIGRKIEVQTAEASTIGRLKEVTDTGLALTIEAKKKAKDTKTEDVFVAFADIRKAKVLVEL